MEHAESVAECDHQWVIGSLACVLCHQEIEGRPVPYPITRLAKTETLIDGTVEPAQ